MLRVFQFIGRGKRLLLLIRNVHKCVFGALRPNLFHPFHRSASCASKDHGSRHAHAVIRFRKNQNVGFPQWENFYFPRERVGRGRRRRQWLAELAEGPERSRNDSVRFCDCECLVRTTTVPLIPSLLKSFEIQIPSKIGRRFRVRGFDTLSSRFPFGLCFRYIERNFC